jgi:amidophosphoribosyltransferase
MGGLFGVVTRNDCVMDLYFGTDYHSHLGTSRAVWRYIQETGFQDIS